MNNDSVLVRKVRVVYLVFCCDRHGCDVVRIFVGVIGNGIGCVRCIFIGLILICHKICIN